MRTIPEIQKDLDQYKLHIYTDIDPMLLTRLTDAELKHIEDLYTEMNETFKYVTFLQDRADLLHRNRCIKAQTVEAQLFLLDEIKKYTGLQ